MIEITESNLELLTESHYVDSGRLVPPCLELMGENEVDKALLIHIKKEVELFNRKMHEQRIKKIILRAEDKTRNSRISIPLSYAVYELLKENGYLKSYEEWIG